MVRQSTIPLYWGAYLLWVCNRTLMISKGCITKTWDQPKWREWYLPPCRCWRPRCCPNHSYLNNKIYYLFTCESTQQHWEGHDICGRWCWMNKWGIIKLGWCQWVNQRSGCCSLGCLLGSCIHSWHWQRRDRCRVGKLRRHTCRELNSIPFRLCRRHYQCISSRIDNFSGLGSIQASKQLGCIGRCMCWRWSIDWQGNSMILHTCSRKLGNRTMCKDCWFRCSCNLGCTCRNMSWRRSMKKDWCRLGKLMGLGPLRRWERQEMKSLCWSHWPQECWYRSWPWYWIFEEWSSHFRSLLILHWCWLRRRYQLQW